MGGSGSGYNGWVKDTVGNFYQLDIQPFVREGVVGVGKQVQGSVTLQIWDLKFEVFFASYCESEDPFLQIRHCQGTGRTVAYDIPLTVTLPYFGGVRWWFTCPGVGCGRRVGKLYYKKWFLCRHCLDLTYQSCQDSHKYDALNALVASRLGMTPLEVKKICRGSPRLFG